MQVWRSSDFIWLLSWSLFQDSCSFKKVLVAYLVFILYVYINGVYDKALQAPVVQMFFSHAIWQKADRPRSVASVKKNYSTFNSSTHAFLIGLISAKLVSYLHNIELYIIFLIFSNKFFVSSFKTSTRLF